jgi:hypothetical protein
MKLEFSKFFTQLHSSHSVQNIKDEQHILAVGCSHTYGVGINKDDCYVSRLEKHYNTVTVNLGIPGGNHTLCSRNILHWITKVNIPQLIIAQWPNPVRRISWIGELGQLENVGSCSKTFREILHDGEENFYADWINSIISTNILCKSKGISIINIMLDNIEPCYYLPIEYYGIKLHVDEKQPGLTWFFDEKASDGLHHSAACHQKWAERLIGIIDENTSQ